MGGRRKEIKMTKEEIKVLAYNTIAYAAERLNDDQYSVGWINGVTSIVNEIIEAMEAEEVKAHIEKVMSAEEDEPAETPQPVSSDESEEMPKRKGGKAEVKLDMPAVKAMRDAGRTWAWIADEFGCSIQTVINHYKKVYGDD